MLVGWPQVGPSALTAGIPAAVVGRMPSSSDQTSSELLGGCSFIQNVKYHVPPHNGNFLQLAGVLWIAAMPDSRPRDAVVDVLKARFFIGLYGTSKNTALEIMIPFLLGFLLAQYPQHMHRNSIEIDSLMAGNGFG